MMARRTVVFHDGALGDLLLSIPALCTISACSNTVHLAGRLDAARLLKDLGCVDEALDVGSSHFASLHAGPGDERARTFLSEFDSAAVFTRREEAEFVRNVREIIPLTTTVLTIPPETSRIHVAEFRTGQLRSAAGADNPESIGPCPPLTIPAVRVEEARTLLQTSGHAFDRPLIAIHPGSGGPRKCWPLGKYVRLVGTLQTVCDAFIVFLSGPAEGMEVRDTLTDLSDAGKGILHVHDRDLLAVAAIISLCDLYIGNDSGISHLAALANGKVVVLFGPTDPLIWRPLGAGVRIVASSEKCAPCGDERSRACLDRRCLAAISVEDAVGEADRFCT